MLSNLAGIVEKGKLVIPYDEQDRLKQLKTKMRFYKLDDKGLSHRYCYEFSLSCLCLEEKRE